MEVFIFKGRFIRPTGLCRQAMSATKDFLTPHERLGEAEQALAAGGFNKSGTPKNKKQYPKNDIEKPTGII